ncbi:MAG TPA: PEGA domain-containing protein [Candidatus Dormibacteraeota bacterium]|nr:PEGA domain-containing protein [Candidatus Dormibacteraeota bacterium]
MSRVMYRTAFVVFLLVTKSRAQSGAVIPQADAGHASQTSCVILQRMGRVDRAKSTLYSFGIRGKQFRYIEGKLPEGFPFHRRMTDHHVRDLQARGAQVIVLESNYTSEDLKQARVGCREETGKTPDQAEEKAPPTPAQGTIASTPALSPKTATAKTDDSRSSFGTTEAALLDVSSTPAEADVYVDEHFSGRTPSTFILMPGDHKIVIKKSGFVLWERKFSLPSGHSNIDADLVPKAK